MKSIQRTPFEDRRLSQRLQKNKYQEQSIREHAYSQHNFNSNSKQRKRNSDVRESKKTLSKNNSFRDEIYGSAVAETVQEFHDFTFYPSDIQKIQKQQSIPLKTIYKFSNQSFQCVLFYALIYNHLHLEQIKQNLPEITTISLNCYELIKKNLLKYDQIMIKKKLQNYIFPQSAFRLIQNKSLSLKDRKTWLNDLINKIDPSSELVELMCKDEKLTQKQTALQLLRKRSLWLTQTKQPITQEQRLSCMVIPRSCLQEKKNSCITVPIKDTEDSYFHLKKLTCYEQNN